MTIDVASWQFWVVPVIACAVSWCALRWLLSARMRHFAVDMPNERSLHSTPIPRTGGIALMAGTAIGVWACAEFAPLLAVALGLSVLSLLDDRVSLPVILRFVLHMLAATLAVHWSTVGVAGAVGLTAVLCVAWMTNLYNFMDGSDGLAAGMAISGFGAFAWAAGWAGHGDWAAALLCIAGASMAFLGSNWPPAKVFLGDVGSIPLGFLAAAVGVWGWARQWWPVWFPPMVFAPFVADATLTLLRRGVRGEKIWQAHREHSYQRLVLSGWSKRKLMIRAHALMLVCGAWGLMTVRLFHGARVASLSAFVIMIAAIFLAIEWHCRTPRVAKR